MSKQVSKTIEESWPSISSIELDGHNIELCKINLKHIYSHIITKEDRESSSIETEWSRIFESEIDLENIMESIQKSPMRLQQNHGSIYNYI